VTSTDDSVVMEVRDKPLDLTAALKRIYAAARYDLRIDYRQPPPPPDFSAEDAAWVAQITAPPPQAPTA
jgi:hypothetical protein